MDADELRNWLYQNYPADWQVINGGAYIYTPAHDYHVCVVWPAGIRLVRACEPRARMSTTTKTFVEDLASLWMDPVELAPDWLRPLLSTRTP
jgi:hypothetical protein